MAINEKVKMLQGVRESLEQFEFDGLTGESLWNSIWLFRKIKHLIEGTAKVAGLDKQGCDRLHLEACEVPGVYEFTLRDSRRTDYTKFGILLCERFGLTEKEVADLKQECTTESTCVRLDYNKAYAI